MARGSLSVVLLITVHVCCAFSQSDPACTTPTRKEGFCVPIERCRNINNIVKSPTPPSLPVQNYIARAKCTLLDVERSVCCQVAEVNFPTTTPMPTTTPQASIANIPSLIPTTDCGRNINSRMSNGNDTTPFEYPWMVVLRYLRNGKLVDRCGGSLINNRYVLTAAHCVQTPSNLKLSKVLLGEHDTSKEVDCIMYASGDAVCADRPIEVDIESTVVHSEFNRPIPYRHDIALVRMAREVTFSDSINPICLPIRENERIKVEPEYILTGWGRTEELTLSNILLQAVLKHVPVSECQQKINENRLRINISEEHQMCAGGVWQVDTCDGYDGAPLGFTAGLIDGRFVQYGILSAGVISCQRKSVPAIYTRVSSYINWIVENINP